MAIHLVKLAVGADDVESLRAWQDWQRAHGPARRAVCGARAWPKRGAEVLAGGSLYWVIKGVVAVRQRIVEIAPVTDERGERCGLYLDATLVRTAPQPRRAFQGWRYLEAADAPADLPEGTHGGADLPDALRRELAAIGAW